MTRPPQTPRTPDQRRDYRARCIAAHRCANCAIPRAEGDTQTHLCPKCRQQKNCGSNRAYANSRAQNPPDFARAPNKPFRYGKTRLVSPRRLTIALDEETYFWIKACRQHYCLSPAYEPYQVSEVIRRLLSTLHNPGSDPIPAGFPMPKRGANIGLSLCFLCDAPNFAIITAHHQTTGGTLANAVRDCIKHAAQQTLNTLPGEEAKRLLWPGYDKLPQPAEVDLSEI